MSYITKRWQGNEYLVSWFYFFFVLSLGTFSFNTFFPILVNLQYRNKNGGKIKHFKNVPNNKNSKSYIWIRTGIIISTRNIFHWKAINSLTFYLLVIPSEPFHSIHSPITFLSITPLFHHPFNSPKFPIYSNKDKNCGKNWNGNRFNRGHLIKKCQTGWPESKFPKGRFIKYEVFAFKKVINENLI